MYKTCLILTMFSIILIASTAGATDWSRFRGSNGAGISDTSPLPQEFGPETNLKWKIDVPASASSSVINDEAHFISGADKNNLMLMRIDAETGNLD